MNISNLFDITLTTSTSLMRDKIMELQYNQYYIESLDPTADGKVKIVAKPLKSGQHTQTINDIDLMGFWERRKIYVKKLAEAKLEAQQNKYTW